MSIWENKPNLTGKIEPFIEPKVKVEEKDLKIDEIKRKVSGVLMDALTVFLYSVITLLVLGIYEVFKAGFDWSIYASWAFWTDWLVVQVGSWFTRVWVYQLKSNKFMEEHEIFNKDKDKIQNFVDIDYTTPFIDTNVVLDDKNRKVRAWKNKIKRKIVKLSNKYEVLHIVNYYNSLNSVENTKREPFVLETNIKTPFTTKKREIAYKWLTFGWYTKKRWERKFVKVENKLNDLFNKLTDDYISNNLDNLKVRYARVSRSLLVSGHQPKQQNISEPTYKNNSTTTFFKHTLPSFLMITVFMFLIVPIQAENLGDIEMWLRLILKIALVAMAGLGILLKSKEIFNETYVRATSERANTLNNYYKKHIKEAL